MKKTIFKSICLYVIIFLTYLIIFFDPETIIHIGREDGPIEYMGALFFLLTSVLFFMAYYYSKDCQNYHSKIWVLNRNIFYLFFGILFMVGFGEEISWGQRIFSVQTPAFLEHMNAQKEINVHNLWLFYSTNPEGKRKSVLALMLNMSRLFSIFTMMYCVLLPILNTFSKRFNGWFARFKLPLPPLWLSSIFVLNYILFKASFSYLKGVDREALRSLNELKEANYAFIYFIFSSIESIKQKRCKD